MWNKMQSFGYIKDSAIDINDHIDVAIYKAALDSLLAQHPDDPFYKEKLEMFKKFDL
jgi:hypothetical protein